MHRRQQRSQSSYARVNCGERYYGAPIVVCSVMKVRRSHGHLSRKKRRRRLRLVQENRLLRASSGVLGRLQVVYRACIRRPQLVKGTVILALGIGGSIAGCRGQRFASGRGGRRQQRRGGRLLLTTADRWQRRVSNGGSATVSAATASSATAGRSLITITAGRWQRRVGNGGSIVY